MSSDLSKFPIAAVLFDLDGTLADTAPDLANALNILLIEQGHEALDFETIRPVVSHGGIALIRLGFKLGPESAQFDALRSRLLEIYQDNICQHTCLFPHLQELLNQLNSYHIPWGIVTNKPTWLTLPLLEKMKINPPPKSIVCGDTLSKNKPHPDPIFHACKEIQVKPEHCLYIGDARRDIEAGQAAGMKTIAVAYGYIEERDPIDTWNADYTIQTTEELLSFIFKLIKE